MPLTVPGGSIRNPLAEEFLNLTVALNQGTNTDTASTRAAAAMSKSFAGQRRGLNHAAAAARMRARRPRGGHLVTGHLRAARCGDCRADGHSRRSLGDGTRPWGTICRKPGSVARLQY